MSDNSGYTEMNPFLDGLGRNGATVAMIGGYGLVYVLANYIPKWRTSILMGTTAAAGYCVINNHSIGVRIEF